MSPDVRRLEGYTRQPEDSWLLREHRADGVAPLGPLATPLPLRQIYDGIAPAPDDRAPVA